MAERCIAGAICIYEHLSQRECELIIECNFTSHMGRVRWYCCGSDNPGHDACIYVCNTKPICVFKLSKLCDNFTRPRIAYIPENEETVSLLSQSVLYLLRRSAFTTHVRQWLASMIKTAERGSEWPILDFCIVGSVVPYSELTLSQKIQLSQNYVKSVWICCGTQNEEHDGLLASRCKYIQNQKSVGHPTKWFNTIPYESLGSDQRMYIIRKFLRITVTTNKKHYRWVCCSSHSAVHMCTTSQTCTRIHNSYPIPNEDFYFACISILDHITEKYYHLPKCEQLYMLTILRLFASQFEC